MIGWGEQDIFEAVFVAVVAFTIWLMWTWRRK